jgi:uncharacterized membrane protein
MHQLDDLAGLGALGGDFWGVRFGRQFFIPLVGAAVGVTTLHSPRRSATSVLTTDSLKRFAK